MFHKIKMQTMLFLLFVLLSVVPLLIFGVYSTTFYNHQLVAILENELSVAASTQVDAIDNFFSERDTEVSVIAEYDAIHSLLKLSNEQNTQAHTSERDNMDKMLSLLIAKSNYVESITVTDKHFRIVSCSQWVPEGEISALKNLDSKYRTPKLQFTPVLEEKEMGNTKRIITAAKQIVLDGKLLGYVVEEINLSFFEKVRLSANLLNGGTIYLLDGNSNLITAGNNQSSLENFLLPKDESTNFSRAWNSRDQSLKSGILKYKILRENYISYYSKFDRAGWTMLATVSADKSLQTQKRVFLLGIIALFIVLVILIAVNYIISIRIAKPLAELIKKFKKITESKDYSIRMENTSNAEFGTISKEINLLLDHIEHNIEEEKNKQHYLREKAEKDPLTGLLNKAAIEDAMQKELLYARTNNKQIIFLFIDVDDFKNFNTNYGHSGGDKTLCFLADTLRRQCQGICGRIGGDEFAICISNHEEVDNINFLVENIIAKLRQGVKLCDNNGNIPLYCCIGGVKSDVASSYEELMKIADNAMYEVKESGKNGYKIINN